jgi:hypothetical protein
VVALFNFDDEAKDLDCALPEGRWHAFELWSERYLGVREGRIDVALVQPHSCRVVALRPADDAPTLVGSTAHIGCGWLDITSLQRADDTLRIDVALAGARARRLVIATAGSGVRSVTVDGAETAFEMGRDTCVIPLVVDDPAVVEVRFESAAGR